MSTIEEDVKKIVVEHLGIAESKVTYDAKFIDDPYPLFFLKNTVTFLFFLKIFFSFLSFELSII